MRAIIGKLSLIHILRRVCQIATFILMPGLFALVFSAIGQIYIAIISNSFDFVIFFPQLFLVLAVLVITALLGRFFCGFICAFGSMHDLFWFLSRKIFKRQIPITPKADQVLKYFKYLVLIFIIVFIWTIDISLLNNIVNPWIIFGMYASYTGWPDADYLWSIGGLLLLLIIIGSMFIERFFCRYLCPLGAIFVIISRFRLFRIKKPRSKCGHCQLCTRKCEMGIPLYLDDMVRSGECINCFTCQDVCPKDNVSTNSKESVIAAVAVISISGLYYLGNIVDISAADEEVNPPQIADNSIEESGQYEDGVYNGSAPGFKGMTQVQVIVENGNISEIEVISTDDDEPWFDRVQEPIISSIISQQTTEVDAISGATYSSLAIINAVANALTLSGTDESVLIEEQAPVTDNGSQDGSGNNNGNGKNKK